MLALYFFKTTIFLSIFHSLKMSIYQIGLKGITFNKYIIRLKLFIKLLFIYLIVEMNVRRVPLSCRIRTKTTILLVL